MPTFPKTEAEIAALATAMIAGYTAHPEDFPSVTLAGLETAFSDFMTKQDEQTEKKSQSRIATEIKDEKLELLVEVMRNDLKLSEVDVADDPEKLTEIGWGPRQQPQPVPPPGQPVNFVPTVEGPGDVWFEWESPENGGIIRNYIIERRVQPAGGGDFGAWEVIETSLATEIHLLEQPRGIQMEYRVTSANNSGKSLPSNTAAVVL